MENPEQPNDGPSTSGTKPKKYKIALSINKPSTEKKTKKTRKPKKPQKSGSDVGESSEEEEEVTVDFNCLSIHTLRKYRKHFKLTIASNLNKQDLVNEINNHFPKIELEDEDTVIANFLQMISIKARERS